MVLFQSIAENIVFEAKTAETTFCQPLEKLGYSFFQHLVTLEPRDQNLTRSGAEVVDFEPPEGVGFEHVGQCSDVPISLELDDKKIWFFGSYLNGPFWASFSFLCTTPTLMAFTGACFPLFLSLEQFAANICF